MKLKETTFKETQMTQTEPITKATMIIKHIKDDWYTAEGFCDGEYYLEYGHSLLEALERLFISIKFAE